MRQIHLAAITRCSADMDDARVVSVMYTAKRADGETEMNDRVEFQLASLLDAQHVRTIVNNVIAQKKTAAVTVSTAAVSPSSAGPSPSSSATSSPSSSVPSSPPSPATPTSPTSSPASSVAPRLSPSGGQPCVLKGYVDLQCAADKDTPWQRRFARLYSNRLVLYRTSSSSLPLHVFPLNGSPLSANRSSVRTNRYQHVVIDLASEQSGVRVGHVAM